MQAVAASKAIEESPWKTTVVERIGASVDHHALAAHIPSHSSRRLCVQTLLSSGQRPAASSFVRVSALAWVEKMRGTSSAAEALHQVDSIVALGSSPASPRRDPLTDSDP